MERDQKLYDTCKEWMQKQDKLELFRDYNDYLEPDQVKDFLNYCKEEISNGNYYEPATYLYDWLTWAQKYDWFNDYEQQEIYEKYRKPFEDEYGEEEWYDDCQADEILRDLMYDLDMYDSCIEHFDTDYHFYILTNPDKTALIYDYPYYKDKRHYLKAFQKSQWWTENSKSMFTMYDWAYDFLGLCVKVNINLFDFVNLMKAKQLTIKAWSSIFLFNPFNWSGWCDVDMERDWTIRNKDIWFGIDDAKRGPRGYTPDEVYWWYHPAFNKNKITFKSLRG